MTDPTEATAEQCDVAVIGGGPAGSTAAALLARRGYKVIALEKARHPRFHIGESLLPMNLPLFERLGVLDKVRALGVFKPGADFEADNERGYNTYAFARAIGNSPPHAYQVWRQDFDKMLYDHARGCGADAREGHEVVAVEQNGPRDSRLEVRTDDGRQLRHSVPLRGGCQRPRRLSSAKKQLRRKNTEHQSAAIFGHFRGALRRPGEDAGNISIYSFEHGWMWMIPLPGGVMSVGAVCRPDYLKQRKGRTVEFLLDTLKCNPALWRRLEGAELIGDEVRVTGNYSYDSARMGGSGLGAGRRCLRFSRPGVLLRGVSGHERRGTGGGCGRRRFARSGARSGAPAQAGEAPARRHGALLLFHLPLQRSGHATDVPRAAQYLAARTGRDLHARRRLVRHAQGAVAPEAVQADLCPRGLRDWRRWRAEHKYRLAQARPQFTGGQYAPGQGLTFLW